MTAATRRPLALRGIPEHPRRGASELLLALAGAGRSADPMRSRWRIRCASRDTARRGIRTSLALGRARHDPDGQCPGGSLLVTARARCRMSRRAGCYEDGTPAGGDRRGGECAGLPGRRLADGPQHRRSSGLSLSCVRRSEWTPWMAWPVSWLRRLVRGALRPRARRSKPSRALAHHQTARAALADSAAAGMGPRPTSGSSWRQKSARDSLRRPTWRPAPVPADRRRFGLALRAQGAPGAGALRPIPARSDSAQAAGGALCRQPLPRRPPRRFPRLHDAGGFALRPSASPSRPRAGQPARGRSAPTTRPAPPSPPCGRSQDDARRRPAVYPRDLPVSSAPVPEPHPARRRNRRIRPRARRRPGP